MNNLTRLVTRSLIKTPKFSYIFESGESETHDKVVSNLFSPASLLRESSTALAID